MSEAAKAGWYRQGDLARYWDGATWTEQYRPATGQPPPPTTPREADEDRWRQAAPWLMFGGAAAVAVGCFMPWVKASAPLMGSVTISGVDDGGDGTIFLLLAVALAALVFRSMGSPSRAKQVAVVLVIVALGAMTIYELGNIADRFAAAEAASDLISTSYGSGLVLIGAGVLAAFVGWARAEWRVA